MKLRADKLKKLFEAKGITTKTHLLAIKNIKSNTLSEWIFKCITKGDSDELDFDRLFGFVSAFMQSNNDLEKKLKVLFMIYGSGKCQDGSITNRELFEILRLVANKQFRDNEIQNITDKTFARLGEYKNAMTYDDFKRLITESENTMKEISVLVSDAKL